MVFGNTLKDSGYFLRIQYVSIIFVSLADYIRRSTSSKNQFVEILTVLYKKFLKLRNFFLSSDSI